MLHEWFEIGRDVPERAAVGLKVMSFLLPLALWSVLSYVPFLWHPFVTVESPGSVSYFQAGMLVERAVFASENLKASAQGAAVAHGTVENPIYLPAPHAVLRALY